MPQEKNQPNVAADDFAALAAAQVEPEIIREMLKVYLNPEQKEMLGQNMARGISLLADLKAQLDTAKAQFKGRITAVEGEIAESARMLNIGYQMANVECRVIRNFEHKTVTLYRMDTDPEELVSERPMTRDELQRKLDFDAAQAAICTRCGERPARSGDDLCPQCDEEYQAEMAKKD